MTTPQPVYQLVTLTPRISGPTRRFLTESVEEAYRLLEEQHHLPQAMPWKHYENGTHTLGWYPIAQHFGWDSYEEHRSDYYSVAITPVALVSAAQLASV